MWANNTDEDSGNTTCCVSLTTMSYIVQAVFQVSLAMAAQCHTKRCPSLKHDCLTYLVMLTALNGREGCRSEIDRTVPIL